MFFFNQYYLYITFTPNKKTFLYKISWYTLKCIKIFISPEINLLVYTYEGNLFRYLNLFSTTLPIFQQGIFFFYKVLISIRMAQKDKYCIM